MDYMTPSGPGTRDHMTQYAFSEVSTSMYFVSLLASDIK